MDNPEHEVATRRSGYRYVFSTKHHRGGSSGDAQWRDDITREAEFSVFDTADFHEISDERGALYGVLKEDGRLRHLGTWEQQMAEFPFAREGAPWHGYPIWAISREAPENRRGEDMRPSKQVFVALEQAGLITPRQKKHLLKGWHA